MTFPVVLAPDWNAVVSGYRRSKAHRRTRCPACSHPLCRSEGSVSAVAAVKVPRQPVGGGWFGCHSRCLCLSCGIRPVRESGPIPSREFENCRVVGFGYTAVVTVIG